MERDGVQRCYAAVRAALASPEVIALTSAIGIPVTVGDSRPQSDHITIRCVSPGLPGSQPKHVDSGAQSRASFAPILDPTEDASAAHENRPLKKSLGGIVTLVAGQHDSLTMTQLLAHELSHAYDVSD